MLSDALRAMRDRIQSGVRNDDPAGIILTLRAFEMEARNMEERIQHLTGRPHSALDGRLMAVPAIEIAAGGGAGMTDATSLIAFIKTFAQLHMDACRAIDAAHAGTIATLLDCCEADILVMERKKAERPASRESSGNVITVKFTRPTPPTGGDAA